MKAYMGDDTALADQLLETVYAKPALPPATPWLGKDAPVAPYAEVTAIADGEVTVARGSGIPQGARWWVVQVEQAGKWSYDILAATDATATVKLADAEADVDRVTVSSVSRTGIQGARKALAVPRAENIEEAAEEVSEAVEEEAASEPVEVETAEDATK
jgi:VCBS repeat-containing protein